jgi:hypothetical protein
VLIEEIFEFASQKYGKYTRILNTKLREVHKETNFGQMAVLLLFECEKIPENNTFLFPKTKAKYSLETKFFNHMMLDSCTNHLLGTLYR